MRLRIQKEARKKTVYSVSSYNFHTIKKHKEKTKKKEKKNTNYSDDIL